MSFVKSSLSCLFLVSYLMLAVQGAPSASGPAACNVDSIDQLAQQTGQSKSQLALDMHQTCIKEFLSQHSVETSVKETVDKWLGANMAELADDNLAMIHQVALMSEKPDSTSQQFKTSCAKMNKDFEIMRDSTDKLSGYIDEEDLTSYLSRDDINDNERQLLNYIKYTILCSALLD